MAVFVFASVLAHYKKTHDAFFDKADRIYTIGSIFSPTANVGVIFDNAAYTALAPFLEADVPDIEAVARIVRQEFFCPWATGTSVNGSNSWIRLFSIFLILTIWQGTKQILKILRALS